MSDPKPALEPGEIRLHDRCVPAWTAGEHAVTVTQEVYEAPASGTPGPRRVSTATQDAADTFWFQVGGAAELTGDDVHVAFPTPGCEDATDVMLPHLVLRRRTLPWERSHDDRPWVALLLLVDGEYELQGGQVRVEAGTLHAVLPRRDELALLCHVRELCRTDREARDDDDGFVAVVVGNRLPQKAKAHLCCLVSVPDLPQDVWPEGPAPGAPAAKIALRVLHSWTFKADRDGGDFEARLRAVCFGPDDGRDLHPRPGGVARFAEEHFGHVPLDITTRDGERETAWYRGPLAPVPLQRDSPAYAAPDDEAEYEEWKAHRVRSIPRSADDAVHVTDEGELVLSYAAAFELGRVLALGSPESLALLQDVRARESETVRKRAFFNMMANSRDLSELDLGAGWDLEALINKLLGTPIINFRDSIGPGPVIGEGGDRLSLGDASGIRDLVKTNVFTTPAEIELDTSAFGTGATKVDVMGMKEQQLSTRFSHIMGPVIGRMNVRRG